MDKISIVVPCYNEQEALPYFFSEIILMMLSMNNYKFELILIDDGSSDNTTEIIREYALNYDMVKYIVLSRNFGKESAMYAGLQNSSGNYIVVMDVDLQDPPELVPIMLDIIKKEGFDSVATRRVTRKGEPRIRSFFARMFYYFINKMSKTEVVDGARDYRMMTRQFLDSLLTLKEYTRFSKGLYGWVGYKTKWIEYENRERIAGETKWSFWKLLIYAIEGITSFSTTPLVLASVTGFSICILAFLMLCVVVFRTLAFGDPVSGWPSIVCIILFLGGIQLFFVGILGKYLSTAYLEVKKRPIYICRETNITADKNKDVISHDEKVKL